MLKLTYSKVVIKKQLLMMLFKMNNLCSIDSELSKAKLVNLSEITHFNIKKLSWKQKQSILTKHKPDVIMNSRPSSDELTDFLKLGSNLVCEAYCDPYSRTLLDNTFLSIKKGKETVK